jgi:acetyl-CoA carboxylase biotin carboxyl carrier protein
MNIKDIQSIIKDFENSTLTSLELEYDDFKLKVTKDSLIRPVSPSMLETHPTKMVQDVEKPSIIQPTATHNCVPVKSPLVGTYYASSTPKGDPFVQVGQAIKKGDPVCIIEAMKIMNEITSPCSGVIERIDVINGQVVGYDQVLITIHTGEGRGE